MRAQLRFSEWLNESIDPFALELGFRRSGLTFRLRATEATAVIGLHKHPRSTTDQIFFWISAGVWSSRLAEIDVAFERVAKSARAAAHACQWSVPFSDLMAEEIADGSGGYWCLRAEDTSEDANLLAATVRDRLENRAIPMVLQRASELGLRDQMLATEVGTTWLRTEHLLMLVRLHGPSNLLPGLELEMRQRGRDPGALT